MKGIVFTEFLEMVESEFGLEIVEQVIQQSDLPNDGVYTAVGTYDPNELVHMVVKLSEIKGATVPELVKAFGIYLYNVFKTNFNMFFEGKKDAYEFLENVDQVIHIEIKKLYPDATLPKFTCTRSDKDFVMVYESKLPFADLAEGLITACIKDFQTNVNLIREDCPNDSLNKTIFTLRY